jgi:hypothetical protein
MNLGRHLVVTMPWLAPNEASLPPASSFLTEAGYWLLPKPADMVLALEDLVGAGQHFASLSSNSWFPLLKDHGYWDPMLSLVTSLLFGAVMLILSARQLAQTDY